MTAALPFTLLRSSAPKQTGLLPPRGFTILELMLALALSGIVILAATSLFWLVYRADAGLSIRFDEQIQLASAQRTLRRAMGSFVASRPEDPPATPTPADAGDTPPPEVDPSRPASRLTPQERAARERLATLVTQMGGDEALLNSVLGQEEFEHANFELYFVVSPEGRTLPRLELTLMRQPVKPPSTSASSDEPARVVVTGDRIRGSFDLIEEGPTMTLFWRPIEPAGEPTPLVENLVWAEWWALPRRRYGTEWVDVYAAYIEERFPVAVRLALWTDSGMHTDWLFETAVTTPNQ